VPEHTYRNFDLLIEGTGAGGYRARVLASPAGETGPVPVRMPFSDLEVENFLLKIGRPRRHTVRGVNSPEAAAIRQFGGRLFDAVFLDDLRETLTRSVDEVEGQDAGLRLRLRLADCPELADLPWEYIYDPRARRFLALSQWTPVVRYLDLRRRIPPLSIRPPLRILMMAASPTDFDRLDVDGEWAKVRDALGELQRSGRVQMDRVPTGTLADLRRQLRRSSYHVFHYVGHGRYNPDTGDGELALEGPGGRAQLISGAELGARLSDHRSLRLAVLNSCEGARSGRTDPYSGTAQSLVYQGIPAVVAMQFEITDQAAITFAQNLYEAVADGLPLDAAMAEARNAILDQPNPVEWATPVLYLRAPDGRIFDVTEPGTPSSDTTEPIPTDHRREAQLLDQARAQHRLGHYDATLRLLNDLLTLNPTYPEAAELQSTTLHDKRLADIYRRAVEAETAANWPTAVASYTEILDTDPTYRDAAARRAACERRQQIADLQAELRHHATAESWQAVLDADEQLRRLDPATADPDGLATHARHALEEAQRAADLEHHYVRARTFESDGNWTQAAAAYTQLLQVDPDFRDAAARKEACERRQQIADLQAELRHHATAESWQAVLDADEQLRRLDPATADPDGLATHARHALQQAERTAERARVEALQQVARGAEERARREAAERARVEALQQVARGAEERARREAAERAAREYEERLRREAEEMRAGRDLNERTRKEAAKQAHLETLRRLARGGERRSQVEARRRKKASVRQTQDDPLVAGSGKVQQEAGAEIAAPPQRAVLLTLILLGLATVILSVSIPGAYNLYGAPVVVFGVGVGVGLPLLGAAVLLLTPLRSRASALTFGLIVGAALLLTGLAAGLVGEGVSFTYEYFATPEVAAFFAWGLTSAAAAFVLTLPSIATRTFFHRDIRRSCVPLIIAFTLAKLTLSNANLFFSGVLIYSDFILLALVASLMSVLRLSHLQRAVGLVAVTLLAAWSSYWVVVFGTAFPLWELLTLAVCYLAQIGLGQGHVEPVGGAANRR
jgi:tetratricopeptide (TPR) repeat protein